MFSLPNPKSKDASQTHTEQGPYTPPLSTRANQSRRVNCAILGAVCVVRPGHRAGCHDQSVGVSFKAGGAANQWAAVLSADGVVLQGVSSCVKRRSEPPVAESGRGRRSQQDAISVCDSGTQTSQIGTRTQNEELS